MKIKSLNKKLKGLVLCEENVDEKKKTITNYHNIGI